MYQKKGLYPSSIACCLSILLAACATNSPSPVGTRYSPTQNTHHMQPGAASGSVYSPQPPQVPTSPYNAYPGQYQDSDTQYFDPLYYY